MLKDLPLSGVVLLQAVGFDVVSLWSSSGYSLKATVILAALGVLFILGYLLSKAFK